VNLWEKNNEALVFIKAFLTFSPIKSCLENLTTLRQRTELLLAESVKGGFFTSHIFTRERCIDLVMF